MPTKAESIPVIDLDGLIPPDRVSRYEFACRQIVDPIRGESPLSAKWILRKNFRAAKRAIYLCGNYWFRIQDGCGGSHVVKAGRYEAIPNP